MKRTFFIIVRIYNHRNVQNSSSRILLNFFFFEKCANFESAPVQIKRNSEFFVTCGAYLRDMSKFELCTQIFSWNNLPKLHNFG